MARRTTTGSARVGRTPLDRDQIVGFWSAWAGWMLDGMDSFIYALVLRPALAELLPRDGIAPTPQAIGSYGSILFALFLVGWGLSFIWGPIADRFGRTRTLAGTILVYAVFTGAAYFATSVWQLAAFRFLAGMASAANGRWPAPMSPKPGPRTAARWAPATCRRAIMPASSSPPG